MKELRTEIEIQASPERVWDILLNFQNYPQWNPFIQVIDGNAVAGSRLRVRLCPPDGQPMTFKPTITQVQPCKTFQWLGRLLVSGLFDGEHRFEIEPIKNRGVRFINCETFRGLLVPLLWKTLDANTRRGFEQMNQALKQQAEAAASSDVY